VTRDDFETWLLVAIGFKGDDAMMGFNFGVEFVVAWTSFVTVFFSACFKLGTDLFNGWFTLLRLEDIPVEMSSFAVSALLFLEAEGADERVNLTTITNL